MHYFKLGNLSFILSLFLLTACSDHDDEPYITDLQIIANSTQFPAGFTTRLQATLYYSNGTTYNVSPDWSSNDLTIATVDQSGLVQSLSAGEVSISASYSGFSNSINLLITNAELVAIQIYALSGSNSTSLGLPMQYSATGTFTDDTQHNISSVEGITWFSEDESVAAFDPVISENDYVTAQSFKEGSTRFSARLGAIESISLPLTVNYATIVSTSISPDKPVSVPAGYDIHFNSTATYSDGSTVDGMSWRNSDTDILTNLNSGDFRANTEGESDVWATYTGNDVSDKVKVTVTNAILENLIVSSEQNTLPVGLNMQFNATAYFSDHTELDITTFKQTHWQSSDITIASVDLNGVVHAKNQGLVTIQANSFGVISNKTIQITPAVLTEMEVTPAEVFVAEGGSQQYTAIGYYSDGSFHDLTNHPLLVWTTGSVDNPMDPTGLFHNLATDSTTYSSTGIAANMQGSLSESAVAHLPFTPTLTTNNLTFVAALTEQETYDADLASTIMETYTEDGITGPLDTSYTIRSFIDALVYCDDLDYGGYDDYRIPLIAELEQLYASFEDETADDNNRFFTEHKWATGLPYTAYDGDTGAPGGTTGVYNLNLATGQRGVIRWENQLDNPIYTLCVRNLTLP